MIVRYDLRLVHTTTYTMSIVHIPKSARDTSEIYTPIGHTASLAAVLNED
jgi:hypothetical protein